MKLIDTNVLISFWDDSELFHNWAEETLSQAVAAGEACVSAVTVAELCSFAGKDSVGVVDALGAMNIELLDVPVGASVICGEAYKAYLARRKAENKTDGPRVPLPDFFIGAHAELMGFELVTNDRRRFKTYFPSVKLIVPPSE